MNQSNINWESVLTLNANRERVDGSTERLADAIRRGADLRIYTEFRNDEHLETKSENDEVVEEVSEFRVNYLLDDRWVAGIMNLRQPILPPIRAGDVGREGDRRRTQFFLRKRTDWYNRVAGEVLRGVGHRPKSG